MPVEQKHRWSEPNDEGISTCDKCPCLRKLAGKHFKTYRPRKTADWSRYLPPCTIQPKIQRANACTRIPPPKSDSVPDASKT